MSKCVKCGHVLPADFKVFRQTLCPDCGAYLHACIQCALHDPRAHNQCLEPQAEFVANREKANFCEFFQMSAAPGAAGAGQMREKRAQEARARLESLFQKPARDESDDTDA